MTYDIYSVEHRNALKDVWVAELRSGKYEQVRSHLHIRGKGFCCLGVLANCVDPVWTSYGDTRASVMQNSFAIAETYDCINDFVGSADLAAILYNMNDVHKKSFDEIADYIDAHWDTNTGYMTDGYNEKGDKL